MNPTKPTSAATKGLVISLLLIVFSLLVFYSGMREHAWLQYVGYVIFIIGLIWSVSSYAKQIDYNATFGKYFLHGFAVTAIITCAMLIFSALLSFLDPSMKQQMIDKTTEELRKNRSMGEEQIEQTLDITRRFYFVMLLIGVLFSYMFFGTIVSLVAAAVTKKNPHLDFPETKPLE